MDESKLKISDPVYDRKSKFIGVCATVSSKKEIDEVLTFIKEKKEFKKPTHIISAYRFMKEDKLVEKKNDDGETGAGFKLLELLRRKGKENILVVVLRWYGGVKIGSDRFRHIVAVAEAALPGE
ncbi:MAG: YigZ family protein [bacterium]|nr:YigZ family protein [bacterium]